MGQRPHELAFFEGPARTTGELARRHSIRVAGAAHPDVTDVPGSWHGPRLARWRALEMAGPELTTPAIVAQGEASLPTEVNKRWEGANALVSMLESAHFLSPDCRAALIPHAQDWQKIAAQQKQWKVRFWHISRVSRSCPVPRCTR